MLKKIQLKENGENVYPKTSPKNEYSTSTEDSYSANYINTKFNQNETTIWTGNVSGTNNRILLNKVIEPTKKYKLYLDDYENRFIEISGKDILESNADKKIFRSCIAHIGGNYITIIGIGFFNEDTNTQAENYGRRIIISQVVLVQIGSGATYNSNQNYITKVTEI